MQKGYQIEQESFRIIDSEMKKTFPRDIHTIVRRVIHATGDFEFEDILRFHPEAVKSGIEAIRRGGKIFADVKMVEAGISSKMLQQFSMDVSCLITDDDVVTRAHNEGLTRAEAAVEKAAALLGNDIGIVAIGNAPTALLKVMELKDAGIFDPALIIGVPVGFVSAEESKALLAQKNYPFITCIGRKGGSPVAAAIVNAILILAQE